FLLSTPPSSPPTTLFPYTTLFRSIPSRWLATAPNVAQSSYSEALISTADQTEAQVAKACMRAINSGYVLCLAVDGAANPAAPRRSEEHTSELQSRENLVCRLLLEK